MNETRTIAVEHPAVKQNQKLREENRQLKERLATVRRAFIQAQNALEGRNEA